MDVENKPKRHDSTVSPVKYSNGHCMESGDTASHGVCPELQRFADMASQGVCPELQRFSDTASQGVCPEVQRFSMDTLKEDLPAQKSASRGRASLRHMHELYETVAEMTVEPISKDEPDVKAFFKVLRAHRLQSKVVYVLTLVSIVAISHFVLTVRWLLPYYYSLTTPVLLMLRLYMYWRMKYQYFMLDFCYFANIYWYIYIWVAPEREDVFAVGFAVANGPLIWALLVFRNSLVFHSLDKVTSLYIHLLPSLMSFVIRWYPKETSQRWYKPFPESQFGFSFVWLVSIPFVFVVLHQVGYLILVNLILKPSEEYLNLYRYVTRKETSLMFRLCNLLGPRFRVHLYMIWNLTFSLSMLLLTPVWYNFFIAHCVILVIFIILAIFNGATYYIDVFSLEGVGKNKVPPGEVTVEDTSHKNKAVKYGTMVTCLTGGSSIVTTKTVLHA